MRTFTETLAIAFQAACVPSGQSICEEGNRLSVPAPQLRDAVIAELEAQGIPITAGDADQICYLPRHRTDVLQALATVNTAQHKNEITILGGFFSERVKERMRREGIEFSAEEVDGETVLSIGSDDKMGQTREIIDEVADELLFEPR